MKEKGFIAHQHEVKAILEGRQTMFRRVIKPQPHLVQNFNGWQKLWMGEYDAPDVLNFNPKFGTELFGVGRFRKYKHLFPYGQVGDRLWVRETWAIREQLWVEDHYEPDGRTIYRADGESSDTWKPSIHMFRRDSRATLEITGVKVERVQDINLQDVMAEGIESASGSFGAYRDKFWVLWNSINAKRGYGWDANPFVWCLTFRVVE